MGRQDRWRLGWGAGLRPAARPIGHHLEIGNLMRRITTALVLSLLSSSLLAAAPAHAQTNGDTSSVNAAGRGMRSAHPASLDAARRSARAAAACSLAAAKSNARTAVQAIGVDLQVLAQWTTAAPPHSVASYQKLLARAHSYDDVINVTAQALADDVQVEARMHAVMPPKAIMVSIGEQVLRAYQDGRLVLFTYVTTGRPELPTVTGHFSIYDKVTPWQFTSPWPPGSPYYYPPTWSKYWMPFYSGYGLHDAPWRHDYGPGANKVARMLPEEYALYDAKEAVGRETRAYEQRVQEAHDPRIRQGEW